MALLFLAVVKYRQNEAAKKEMGVQLRKSKAWFGKSRDPQGFLFYYYYYYESFTALQKNRVG